MENAFIESFNGRLRDECLNLHRFMGMAHAQQLLDSWRHDYNHRRPHGALGHLTPSEYVERSQQHGGAQLRPTIPTHTGFVARV